VEIPSGRAVLGGALVLAIAAGFEFEVDWLFTGALVVFLGWCGFVLFHPADR
jgi:hypothetical protein